MLPAPFSRQEAKAVSRTKIIKMNKPYTYLKVLVSCLLILLKTSVALSKGQTRIVNGTDTTIDKAPFLVQILVDGSFRCGGTLVSENFVISAAHCFENIRPSRFLLMGGSSKRFGFGIRSKISKIMIPSEYKRETVNMDVAVIKLLTPMVGPLVKPIDLCKTSWSNGDSVQIYGWGRTSETSRITNQMSTVTVNVIDTRTCEEMYHNRRNLTDSMFCAAAPGKDSCSGDSGGPAIINHEFCGVISWGVGCARSNSPGVYTNLLAVQHFIASAMKQ